MGNCCQKQNFQNYFPADEVLIKEKDRRTKVNPTQFESFPYNNIGWIQSKQIIDTKSTVNSNRSLLVDATGFLISSTMVLTSCHNFVIRDQQKGELKQFVPVTFTVLQVGKEGEKKLVQRCSKVKRVKLNMKYFAILNQIVLLKNLFNSEKGVYLKSQYASNILKLQSEAIQHDFSVLKLETPIERPQYFKLCINFKNKPLLAVTGFQNFYGSEFRLLTHSNFLDSIVDNGLFYDIDTSSGQSGAPVYITSENKRSIIKLVGIQKSYWPRKRLSFATMITGDVVTVLQDWAKQLKSSFEMVDADAMPEPEQTKQYQQQDKNKEQKKPLIIVSAPKILQPEGSIVDAPIFNQKGNEYFEKGQMKQAFEYYSKALRIYEKDEGSLETIDYANTLKNIGSVYEEQLVCNQAVTYYTKALKIYQKIDPNSVSCAQTNNDIGNTFKKRQKFAQALLNYDKSLKIYDKGKYKQTQGCADTLSNIGWIYDHQARFAKALESYNRALSIYQRVNGRDSVNSAVTLNNIGVIYKQLEKPKEALQFYTKALKIYEKIKEKETINCANTLHNIGAAYDDLKKLNEALGFYNRALSLKQRLKGKNSYECASTLYNLGLVYQKLGDGPKANQLFELSSQIKREHE